MKKTFSTINRSAVIFKFKFLIFFPRILCQVVNQHNESRERKRRSPQKNFKRNSPDLCEIQ